MIEWEQSLLTTGITSHKGGNGRPGISEETFQKFRRALQNDATFSIRAGFSRLQLLSAEVHCILRKCHNLFPYKLQNLHSLIEGDKQKCL